MLGLAFSRVFSSVSSVRSPGHKELDVTKRGGFSPWLEWRPHVVVHAAALVNADYCEDHPEECREIQVGGTDNVVAFCRESGARLFYPQSFLIFDGREIPILETTEALPLSVYGKAKLEAERHVLRDLPDSLVVRMAGFFGGSEKDKNFVGKFASHLKRCLAEGVDGVDVGDRVWQPTFTEDIARNSLRLVQENKSGVYNMACKGRASFFELAVEMTRLLRIQDRIRIRKVSNASLREKCVRPDVAVLENARLKKEGLDEMRPWPEALKEYLSEPFFTAMFGEYKNA